MRSPRRLILILTIAVTTCAFALPALAAKPKTSGAKRSVAQVPAAPDQTQDALQLKQQLFEANRAVVATQKERDDFVADRKKKYEATPEVAPLIQAVADDKKALETLVDPIRKKLLETDSRYDMATRMLPESQAKLDEAHAQKKADDITYHQSEVNRLKGIIDKIENDTIGKDPACKAAQAKLAADQSKLDAAMAKFYAALEKDPDYKSLQLAVVNARARQDHLNETADAQ